MNIKKKRKKEEIKEKLKSIWRKKDEFLSKRHRNPRFHLLQSASKEKLNVETLNVGGSRKCSKPE